MMSKEIIVGFTTLELDYLLCLANDSKDSGVYWGRKDYFEKRQNQVIEKLQNAIETLNR